MIKVTQRSHMDHGLHIAVVHYVLNELNAGRATMKVGPYGPFFIAEVVLPQEMFASVPCALHGPRAGDAPVLENEVYYGRRGAYADRAYLSRRCDRAAILSRIVTTIVIANEDAASEQRVDTMYGGPLAEREVGDPSLGSEQEKQASAQFWAIHALGPL